MPPLIYILNVNFRLGKMNNPNVFHIYMMITNNDNAEKIQTRRV